MIYLWIEKKSLLIKKRYYKIVQLDSYLLYNTCVDVNDMWILQKIEFINSLSQMQLNFIFQGFNHWCFFQINGKWTTVLKYIYTEMATARFKMSKIYIKSTFPQQKSCYLS